MAQDFYAHFEFIAWCVCVAMSGERFEWSDGDYEADDIEYEKYQKQCNDIKAERYKSVHKCLETMQAKMKRRKTKAMTVEHILLW